MRKFFKTVIKIEILSEDAPVGDGLSLEDIAYEITEGHCSGVVTTESVDEVHASTMVKLLKAQGSDPGFFMLDDEGKK